MIQSPISIRILLCCLIIGSMYIISVFRILDFTMHHHEPMSANRISVIRKRRHIAYTIPITKDGNFADGAAVLAKSIQLNHKTSFATYDLIALVHPNAVSSIPQLQTLGYIPHVVTVPVNVTDVKSDYYREELPKSGCCGENELIKLEIFRMTQYSHVIMLDADMLLLQPLDHLLEMNKKLIFVYDRSMEPDGWDSSVRSPSCVQGGFLIVQPDVREYQRLIDIVRTGDFRDGTGWEGLGYGWCYGGQTIQGLMSYYVHLLPDVDTYEADPCRVDAMGISTSSKSENCELVDAQSVGLFHFTACEKPWHCVPIENGLCSQMIEEWWNLRRLIEQDRKSHVFSRSEGCLGNNYKSMQF